MKLSLKLLNQILSAYGTSYVNRSMLVATILMVFPTLSLVPKANAGVPEWVRQSMSEDEENNSLTWQPVGQSASPPQSTTVTPPQGLPSLSETQTFSAPSSVSPTVAMLTKPEEFSDDSATYSIQIQSPLDVAVRVRVNGKLVTPQRVTKEKVDPRNNLIVQTWHDVALEIGDNQVEVVDKFGTSLDQSMIAVGESNRESITASIDRELNTVRSSSQSSESEQQTFEFKIPQTESETNQDNPFREKPEEEAKTPLVESLEEEIAKTYENPSGETIPHNEETDQDNSETAFRDRNRRETSPLVESLEEEITNAYDPPEETPSPSETRELTPLPRREETEERISLQEGLNQELTEVGKTPNPSPSPSETRELIPLPRREETEERISLQEGLDQELTEVRETPNSSPSEIRTLVSSSREEETEERISLQEGLDQELTEMRETSNSQRSIEQSSSRNNLIDALDRELAQLQQGETRILTPQATAVREETIGVIIQSPTTTPTTLQVNGKAIDTSRIGRTEINGGIITETWYNIPLEEGENTIQAVNEAGDVLDEVAVQRMGIPQSLRINSQASRIPADGKTTTTITGKVLDETGNVTPYEGVVTVKSSAGEFLGTDAKSDQPGFQVEVMDGRFQATLRSSNDPQTVTLQALSGEKEAYTQLEFEPHLRPSIATGVVNFRLGRRGTNFYDSFRDFLPADLEDETDAEFSAYGAAFATGKVGEWLFTGAFNTDRGLNDDGSGRQRLTAETQADEQIYPVYGDSSVTTNRASSQDSLFLRLEQSAGVTNADPNFFSWGTFGTSEFAASSQTFSATSRSLQGFKGNYTIDDLQLTAFYSDDVEGFERDTIAPDGTSGLYFLSQRLLIPGSEEVYIETERLQSPGSIVSRQQLRRGRDYTVDYDRGTLIFKRPVLRTVIGENGDVLAQRIIVNYQFESDENDTYVAGGRARYHFSRERGEESWLGASYLDEDQGRRDFSLFGIDSQISLGNQGTLVAEYARSEMGAEDADQVGADAYRVEVIGQIAKGVSGRAFWRTTDAGFTNNATASFVPGQTRYGANLQGQVASETTLRARFNREENFGTAPVISDNLQQLLNNPSQPGDPVDNTLTTISAGVLQQLGDSQLTVDWIHRDREDEINNLDSNSDQLRSRLNVPLADNVTAYALNETTLSAETDAVFSDRTALGVGWEIVPGIELGASQQWFTSGQFAGQALTRIDLGGNHHLTEDTTLIGRYSIAGGIDGMTSQAALGLNHQWEVLPGVNLDLGYERVFGGDLIGETASGAQFAQPFAVGQTASSLGLSGGESYRVGIEYTDNPNLKANARFEHRSNRNGNNSIILGSVSGRLSKEFTALARYRQASASNQTLSDLGDTINLRTGIAYRDPDHDQWNALLKYEYRQNPSTLPSNLLEGTGSGSTDHLLSAEAIYAPNWQWEFYGKYAFRDSQTFLAADTDVKSHISLTQLRATHRFAQRWDVTGEVRWIDQHTADFSETGLSTELGYYATPDLRLSVGYSWGEVDDRDFGHDRAAGGPYLSVTYKINELFDGFGRQ